MIRKLLLETTIGDLLCAWLERWCGIALVDAGQLAEVRPLAGPVGADYLAALLGELRQVDA